MLDAKSAFDAVKHAELIRRLYQMKIPEQSILIIDNLYKNAVSCVRWSNQISDTFRIEQDLRQVADPAIYIISGMLPVEAQIDVKILTFYGNIARQAKLYTSLKYLSMIYQDCHPITNTNTMNTREIIRIPTKLKIATGSYILQAFRAKFKDNSELSLC
ncbi:unnamed protein product [Mytilus coruscus]|uniref:Uncharacterized protein n=1 Tax=Mytilus coruscus TaxID=42192 RepID=A0A6J8B983_MYTCO|nr:unnamed protein product [Mytilus coruscus]